MYKKAAIFAIKLCVTAGLFMLLFRPEFFGFPPDLWGEDITLSGLLDEIRAVETHNIVFWLSFAVIVKLAGMLCGVLRWRLLLRGQGIPMPFWYMVQSWFIGRTIGIFLPGTIGLDGYRLYDSSLYTGEVIKSTTVIAIEKLIGVIALTLLVFLTFPLGFRLLNFNLPMLAVVMLVFGGGVVFSLLVLLNPRVIQVVVAALPTPRFLRSKVDKLGAAATAYSGNRSSLLLAVFFGILVHVATCLMYVGTMSAIRAENTTIADIFFTSPLMIWGTVLGPTVGGEGIREIVFTTVLGAKSGSLKAFLIAHLGWWVGELVPFLIGLPIFLLRSRPDKGAIQAELAEARKEAREAEEGLNLSAAVIGDYRRKLINTGLAGLFAGLIAGMLVGLAEAAWVVRSLAGLQEAAALWWGPVVYALCFGAVGAGIAAGLAFLYLMTDRFAKPTLTFGLTLGASLAGATVVLGLWRLKRDVLAGHAVTPKHLLGALVIAVGLGIISVLGGMLLARLKANRKTASLAAVMAMAVLVILGAVLSASMAPRPEETVLRSDTPAEGPNIILLGIDAMRADWLPAYGGAHVNTPALDAFQRDAVLFEKAFAQASWTKPTFATLFTGLYPEAHTATTKTALLPDDVITVAEVLSEVGYYTKGFSNNPNTTAIFNFDQGFADYVDLKPDLYFGASASASKLTVYEVVRRVKQKVDEKILRRGIRVGDFYQPAESITATALDWLDSGERPDDAPFYLYLHYMDPHDPFMEWDTPGVGYARVRLPDPDPDKYLTPMIEAYWSEIEYLDTHLGNLFEGLRERGLYDDTAIIFVSDHGEEFYDHEGWWHGQTLYEELIHIPMMIKAPGNTGAGQATAKLARHLDVAPTILAFADARQPEAMTGQPLFDHYGQPVYADPGYIYAENDFEGIVLQAVRSYTEKIIHANEGNKRDIAPVECYDLTTDPGEQSNRATAQGCDGQLADILEEMQAFIRENAAEPQLVEGTPAELQEQLDALGYLE